jgi:hypothetical protein
MAGVPDPLRQLPTVHSLLDVVELMLTEGCKDEAERAKLNRDLYMPPLGTPVADTAPPPGFSAAEEMASFAAVAAQFAT